MYNVYHIVIYNIIYINTGQSLAMKEIEAFLANLILNYKIFSAYGNQDFEIKFSTANSVAFVDPQIPVRVEKRNVEIKNIHKIRSKTE